MRYVEFASGDALNSTNDPADLEERLAAVAVERSVIVQAPAGSGKTTLLVQRFLNLLTIVERPEEILAITFTRKAAAEMLERVVAALAEDTERSRAIRARSIARGWHLETQPGRLRIQTIDAFCVGLVQRLPIASGLGDRLRIVEDGEPFYREAIDKTFERIGQNDELNAELVGLLALFDNDFEKARASMSTMLAKRDQWLEVVMLTLRAGQSDIHADDSRRRAITSAIEAGIRALHANVISDVTADLDQRLCNELADVAASAALRLAVDWPSSGLPTELEQWHFIADLITTRGGQPRARLGSAQGFNDTGHANQSAKARLRVLIDDLDRHDMIIRLASLRLLPPPTLDAGEADAIVNVATGLALAATELDAYLSAQWRGRFRRACFRGATRARRFRIANRSRLGAGLSDQASADRRVPGHVGDPVSARGTADPGMAGRRYEITVRRRGSDAVDLSIPRRGRRAVPARAAQRHLLFVSNGDPHKRQLSFITFVGRVVQRAVRGAFGDVEDPVLGRVAFASSTSVRAARPDDGCRVQGIQSLDAERAEAAAITQAIEQLRQNRPSESIAILVRTRTHLAHILPMLTAHGIPWAGSDIHALADQPVIDDLMTLLKALSSPKDRIAWLALLRAPFVGVSLRDLELLAQSNESIAASVRTGIHDDVLSDDGRARLRRIRPTLVQAERSRAQTPVRQWLENAFIRLGGADAYRGDAILHAQRLLALIENTQSRTLDIATLERSVQRLFAESAPRDDGVAVMTIHRAKGLEFDHVLVPGLHRVSRVDDPPPILWRPEAGRLLLGVRGSTVGDGVHRWLSHEERHRDANERLRLLYVAATRARHSLQLFGVLEDDGGDPSPRPHARCSHRSGGMARDRIELVRDTDLRTDAAPSTPERAVLSADYVWRPRTDS